MAKKKTAPVLRVENPGSGDNQSTPVITKSYCVRDDWKDKDIVNYVAFKSVDGGVQDLTVNGQPAGGGGGGGEFSTAEVTVIMEGDGDYDKIRAPLIDGNQATGFGEPRDDTTVFTVILYKGTAIAEINTISGHLSVSGNITITDRVLKITGDGTVTLS